MNPFMSALSRIGGMARNPFANVQQIMNMANQMQQQFGNPEQLVNKFFSDVPQEDRNDPDKIVNYLIQNGRITQQQVDQLKQMFPHA